MANMLSESFSVTFAPLLMTNERRIQTSAMIFTLFWLISGIIFHVVTIWLMLFTKYWFIGLGYYIWIYKDRLTAHVGGRKVELIQRLKLWKYSAEYFPVKLVKTTDLPTNTNYLFCVFPHGVLSFSSFLSFCTEACGFSELFPGIDQYRITLDSNFYAPFTREFYLATGNCASSEQSILSLLKKPSCTACVLVVGGASESLNAYPGSYNIVVKRRTGFIRLALQTGTPLVPVISFGENDLYDQVRGYSSLRKLQNWFRLSTGVSPVLILGRGVFQYTFGLLPFRRPVTTVVGRPIEVTKVAEPSNELIEEYKEKFVAELQKLFDENKAKYDGNGEKAVLIVD